MQRKENELKIANVSHDRRVSNIKKEERAKFTGSFAQAKNLIEKQMKIGNHLRDKKKVTEDNRRKVHSVKCSRSDDIMSQPLKTKVYGGLSFEDTSQSHAPTGIDALSVISQNSKFNKRVMSIGERTSFSTKPNSMIKSFDQSFTNSTRQ